MPGNEKTKQSKRKRGRPKKTGPDFYDRLSVTIPIHQKLMLEELAKGRNSKLLVPPPDEEPTKVSILIREAIHLYLLDKRTELSHLWGIHADKFERTLLRALFKKALAIGRDAQYHFGAAEIFIDEMLDDMLNRLFYQIKDNVSRIERYRNKHHISWSIDWVDDTLSKRLNEMPPTTVLELTVVAAYYLSLLKNVLEKDRQEVESWKISKEQGKEDKK